MLFYLRGGGFGFQMTKVKIIQGSGDMDCGFLFISRVNVLRKKERDVGQQNKAKGMQSP